MDHHRAAVVCGLDPQRIETSDRGVDRRVTVGVDEDLPAAVMDCARLGEELRLPLDNRARHFQQRIVADLETLQ